MKGRLPLLAVLGLTLALASAAMAEEAAPRTSIRWLGQSAFEVTTPGGKAILIDPWLKGNPAAPVKPEDIKKADLILVTHDHFDHLGDAVEIAKATGAVVVGSFDLLQRLVKEGLPEKNALNGGFGMNIGGTAKVAGVVVTMVQAAHTGTPCGFVVTFEDGKRLYDAGDTGLFGDMKLIGDLYPPDLALLPIGDNFTMGAAQAAEALRLVNPKEVIPMHYGTFPILAQDATEFAALAAKKAPGVKVSVLKPGEALAF